ncbi:polysaccharide pyruvyl transferase CsaB [bacterium]|nr:polysaccharide pyruvyl transferase CsaB [bacterium]
MSKNIVISGYYGSDNFGDETILKVLIDKLKQFDTTNITVLSLNPEKTKSLHNVNAIKSFDIMKVISAIFKSDILISGGGSLLQDVTSVKSLFYYLFVIKVAEFFHKKVIIFAQGIGPIKNKFGESMCRKLLKKADCVTVRDDKSLFLLRGWGIGKANLVVDPLFGLNLTGSNPTDTIGIQLRSFKDLSEEFLAKLAKSVEQHFYNKKIQIFSFQDSLDKDICIHFEALLKGLNSNIQTEVIYNKTPDELIKLMGQLQYMIAMRFHACLICARYGIRTLALSYDYKVDKLAEDLKLPCTNLNPDTNIDFYINQMRAIDRNNLLSIVNSKSFDWSYLENLLK